MHIENNSSTQNQYSKSVRFQTSNMSNFNMEKVEKAVSDLRKGQLLELRLHILQRKLLNTIG